MIGGLINGGVVVMGRGQGAPTLRALRRILRRVSMAFFSRESACGTESKVRTPLGGLRT
jgi:hypothetical protein